MRQEKSIKKNTIYNIIKTCSSVIFPLITFPYISRTLQVENVGKINFGASIISYFNLIASLGITTYAIRECSAVRDDEKKLSNTASQIFSINIITTIVSYFLLLITLVYYHKLENYKLLIFIQSLSIMISTLGADWLNQAMEDFRYITIRTVFFQIVGLALMFIFVHKPNDYMKYAVISLLSGSGANIVNIWYRKRYCTVGFIRDIRNGIEWKRHMMPIIYLFVMILAQTIFNSVDSTMLGIIHGDYEVGIYSTAHKISNTISQVIVSIAWGVMPRMSYYFAEDDYGKINEMSRRVLCFFSLVGLPIITGAALLSKDIISIIAGADYAESAAVLQILILGFIFNLFGGSFLGNIILLPSKREKYFMIVCGVAALFNVVANYFLIPEMGARGAALATCICNIVMGIMLVFRIDKRIRITGIKNALLSPSIGCIGISAVCFFCYRINHLYVRMSISMFASICIYCLVQLLGKNELFLGISIRALEKMHKQGHAKI